MDTGGNANWTVVTDPDHAEEGFCLANTAKAGTIANNESTYLATVKTVSSGNLLFRAWVSSETNFDKFYLDFLYNNTGTWQSFFGASGVPTITTPVAYPAAHPESIAVGAITDFGCRANYSEYGPELAFVAPSNGGYSSITTTDRTGTAGYNTSGNYTSTFGGTSSATPLSSGIAGLLLSFKPSMTVAEVRQALQDTADKVGPEAYVSGRNDKYGYGRINAAAAMAALAVCSYTIDPISAAPSAAGGPGSVAVTAGAGCAWTAVSNVDWITVDSGSESGTGNGTVYYTVAANPGTASREGTLTIAGETFTVTEAGFTISSLTPDRSFPFTADGVTAITWTATASGVGPLQYRFVRWQQSTNNTTIVQALGSSTTFTWTPTPVRWRRFTRWACMSGMPSATGRPCLPLRSRSWDSRWA